MTGLRLPVLLLVLAAAPAAGAAGAPASGRPPNLFHELLGKTEAETDAKIDAAWRQLFYGDDATQRVYYPAGADRACITDVGNHDVRTEGMSYGMMIAVQLDHRAEFDRLWKWAKTSMYHASGPRRGYFAWQCAPDGRQLDPGSASDGEEWFAMALFFAAHRWGNGQGIFNYEAEAQALLHEMLHHGDGGGAIRSLFDRAHRQVVFAPTGAASTFTDPSYQLPAFYELWARWAQADRPFWSAAAGASRELFRRAANPRTGLMPDLCDFDGTPHPWGGREDFRFDAWRTLANVGVDYAWFGADPWEVEQSNRVLAFLQSQGAHCPNQFTLAGRPLSADSSPGLFAMAAVAGLAADRDAARPFVQRLWDLPIPSGQWRYYDGMLYFLGLLEAGGRFRIWAPATSP
ncbi:MAG TPA: glycosyl hydrolase family 8 [Opitutaceae bacterium]|nr:glycosyl hydrolase family 8 [Opitutaceae bacterium]